MSFIDRLKTRNIKIIFGELGLRTIPTTLCENLDDFKCFIKEFLLGDPRSLIKVELLDKALPEGYRTIRDERSYKDALLSSNRSLSEGEPFNFKITYKFSNQRQALKEEIDNIVQEQLDQLQQTVIDNLTLKINSIIQKLDEIKNLLGDNN